jgi:hypothetical protein
MKGLEPPRLTAQDPKSCAATNYATSANSLGFSKRTAKILNIFIQGFRIYIIRRERKNGFAPRYKKNSKKIPTKKE